MKSVHLQRILLCILVFKQVSSFTYLLIAPVNERVLQRMIEKQKIEFGRLDIGECDKLAELHRDCLPSSIPNMLGARFLRSFYRFALASPTEEVAVCRSQGVLVAGTLVSFQPATLNRRLLYRTPLIWAVLRNFHRREVRRAIFSHARVEWSEAVPSGDVVTPSPEMIYLFSRADCRGLGIGTRMLEYVNDLVAQAGESRYFIRTAECQDSLALKFYVRHGCVPVGRFNAYGNQFCLLMKNVCANSAVEQRQ